MTRGRDGVDFAAGQRARATAHKESEPTPPKQLRLRRPDAPSLSDTGMQPKTPRPFGLRLGPASAASGRLTVPDPGTASSPFLASIRPEAQRGSRGILSEALRRSVPLDERIVLVVTDQHAMHHVRERGYVESPARIAWIMKELGPTGLFLPVPPRSYPEKHIRDVHASDLVEYIKKACKNAGSGESIYPYVFPIRNAARPPRDLAVRAGYYCVDTFTPLNANAYRAAKRAVDCAMTAAEQILRGHRIAYALVRPPGHHAERRTFGGFCYFNSAAVAAQHLSHHGKVAMLDIDYHHGNGQQDIFYERSDVMTISVHADPRVAYPHFTGFSDERGAGPGEGYNVNLPLPDDVDGERYRETLRRALLHVSRFRPAFLVLALGLDTAKGDPTGSWRLRAADFEIHGTMIGSLRIPTLVTQEGGYSSRSLGTVARRFFQGLWAGYHQRRWEGHSG